MKNISISAWCITLNKSFIFKMEDLVGTLIIVMAFTSSTEVSMVAVALYLTFALVVNTYRADITITQPPFRHIDGIPAYCVKSGIHGMPVCATKSAIFVTPGIEVTEALMAHEATHVKRNTVNHYYYGQHMANAIAAIAIIMATTGGFWIQLFVYILTAGLLSIITYAWLRREEDIADIAAVQCDDVDTFYTMLLTRGVSVTGWRRLIATHHNPVDRITKMKGTL